MSNKADYALNELDLLIRRTVKAGMESGTLVTIEFIWGFELFNTSPYHNHETFSGGYRVSGRGVTVEYEDLDTALLNWSEQVHDAEVKARLKEQTKRGKMKERIEKAQGELIELSEVLDAWGHPATARQLMDIYDILSAYTPEETEK